MSNSLTPALITKLESPQDLGTTGVAQTRSLPPAGDVSPKRPKLASTPVRASQLQQEIASRQEELAALMRAESQEGGLTEPGNIN